MLPFTIHLSKKQQGSGLGTILASIGIPLPIDAFRGKGLQVDRSRSRRSLPVYVPPPTTKKDGGLIIPWQQSPPFYGMWPKNQKGGSKQKKRKQKKKAKGYFSAKTAH